MCQNKPWTDKTGQFPHCDCTLEVPCLLYANGFPVPRRDLNLGRPEHIKRTCDGSIPSNARIRFMLLENSDRNITVLEKSTSNKMSNKIRGATFCLCEYMSNAVFFVGLAHLRTRSHKPLAGRAYVGYLRRNISFHHEASEYCGYSSSGSSNPVRYESQRSKTRWSGSQML